MIATLLDLGWDPIEPATWKDNHGNLWALDGHSSRLRKDLQSIIGATVQDKLWAKASLSYLGLGAEQGVYWHLTLPTLRKLKGKKETLRLLELWKQSCKGPGGSEAGCSN